MTTESSVDETATAVCDTTTTTVIPVPPSDHRTALAALYEALHGSDWTHHTHWLDDDRSVSTWSGVQCNANGLVTALELSNNNVRGRLDDPNVVEALQVLGLSLEQLWLSENNLQGNVPGCLANAEIFPHLTIVDVGSNQLCGSLPLVFHAAQQEGRFSWLDTSGNQFTSYFRYKNNCNGTATPKNDTADLSLTKLVATTTRPWKNVHVTPSVLTKEQGARMIELAIQHAAGTNGWHTNRHRDYQTTDVDVSVCDGALLDVCNQWLQATGLPLLARLFALPVTTLAVDDLFLARYAAELGQQNALAPHKDGSELSFVITLNDPEVEFVGGGTRFLPNHSATKSSSSNESKSDSTPSSITVAPLIPGTGVFFCGRQRHAGVAVTEGTRYILAGFVRVFPSDAEEIDRLQCIVQQCI